MCQRDGGCFGRRSRPKGRASRRPLPPPSAEPARWATLLCALPHRHPRRAQSQQSLSAMSQPRSSGALTTLHGRAHSRLSALGVHQARWREWDFATLARRPTGLAALDACAHAHLRPPKESCRCDGRCDHRSDEERSSGVPGRCREPSDERQRAERDDRRLPSRPKHGSEECRCADEREQTLAHGDSPLVVMHDGEPKQAAAKRA
jgi:hypothetical protein